VSWLVELPLELLVMGWRNVERFWRWVCGILIVAPLVFAIIHS